MKFTAIMTIIFSISISLGNVNAQTNEIKISKLILNKKEKKVFSSRDSSAHIYIDTLIMNDRSSLQFFGKKDVKISVGYAEIGHRVFISGIAGKNNASNFDLDFNFGKLGSLYIVARGQDANNGMKTDPNGDAGNINLVYNAQSVVPQTEDKKGKNYLHTDVNPGGLRVIPTSDLRNIYDQIKRSAPGLRGVPQGQIYSGSIGKEGKVTISSK
ncbi:hypothetical protein [Sphingobacterium bovistauri]|uniref:Uncharacterized protein n=1 Tax=Sphingobacterium bovistauri TaxID=2781959 RepID=A0ABS7ZAD6_9SPHI|nr:hypothetical protein [Sphingobacterium bovistauri]MCA5006552.1 hypothetical protein [Sphingobacterium bovistauri]